MGWSALDLRRRLAPARTLQFSVRAGTWSGLRCLLAELCAWLEGPAAIIIINRPDSGQIIILVITGTRRAGKLNRPSLSQQRRAAALFRFSRCFELRAPARLPATELFAVYLPSVAE